MQDVSKLDHAPPAEGHSWATTRGDCCTAIMQMMPVGLVEMTGSGRITSLNNTARRLLHGLLPATGDSGDDQGNLFEALGPAGSALQDLYAAASKPSLDPLCHNMRIPHPGPDSQSPKTLGLSLTWPTSGVLLAVIDDLTDLVTAESRADAASAAKSEFLADMSHELRQPLNAILGFSDVMRSGVFGPLSERYQGYVGHVIDAGTHLLDLVNDILDLAKIEAGRLELEAEQVLIHDLFHAAGSLIEPLAERHGVHLLIDSVPDDICLWGDPRRLKQVMLNLLSNAVKFTPAGGQVRLGFDAIAAGGVSIFVSDTGCGIAPEDIDRVQEPFVQTAAGRRQADSTGLGLPLAKTLVESHDGRLTLTSTLGQGTTVTASFPARRCLTLSSSHPTDAIDRP